GVRRGSRYAREVSGVIAVLHVRELDVHQRLHRLDRIPRRLWNRAAERPAQIGRRRGLDCRSVGAPFEVLDDSVDDPVAQATHLRGLEPERVRWWTLSRL